MNTLSNKRGFTLLEVMIAIAILAIGMLGVAGLHMVSIEHNNAAYLRSQAITIGQDIVERMRNNRDAIDNNKFDNIVSTSLTMPSSDCLTADEGCSSDQLAAIDLGQWAQMINSINNDNSRQQLPGAKATITADGTVDDMFTIKIEWSTKAWTAVDGATNTYNRTSDTSDYEMQVIIH